MTFNILQHIAKIEVVKETSSEFHCKCPVCGDGGFKIDKRIGKYSAFKCGCSTRSIRDAIEPPVRQGETDYTAPIKRIRPAQTRDFVYTDINGNPTVRVHRVDDGEGGKRCSQLVFHDGRWQNPKAVSEEVKNRLHAISVPYRYLEALEHGGPVFLVEGEGVCDRIRSLGLCAITLKGGSSAKGALPKYAELLSELQLVLCPDRDRPGMEVMNAIDSLIPGCQWAYAYPDSDEWLKLPDAGGLDLEDWLDDGHTLEDVIGLVRSKRNLEQERKEMKRWRLRQSLKLLNDVTDAIERDEFIEELQEQYSKGRKTILELARAVENETLTKATKRLTLAELYEMPLSGGRWLVEDRIPGTGVTILAGPGGAGKTTLAYDLAGCIAKGEEFLGVRPTATGKVLFVLSDEPLTESRERMISRGLMPEHAELITGWTVAQWPMLEQAVADLQPTLVVIDCLASIHGSVVDFDENSSSVRGTIDRLNRIMADVGASCLLLHHFNKDSKAKGNAKMRGSSAIADAANGILLYSAESDTDRKLIGSKFRNNSGFELCLEVDWHLVRHRVTSGWSEDNGGKTNQQKLLEAFEGRPVLSVTELVFATGLERNQVYKAGHKLVRKGELVSVPNAQEKTWKVVHLHCDNGSPRGSIDRSPFPHISKDTSNIDISIDTESSRVSSREFPVSSHSVPGKYAGTEVGTGENPDTAIDSAQSSRLGEDFPVFAGTAETGTHFQEDTPQGVLLRTGSQIVDSQGRQGTVTACNGETVHYQIEGHPYPAMSLISRVTLRE